MFKVSENFFVSGQIDSNSIPALKAESFKTIICNRPDNEEPNQPIKTELRFECEKNDINFHDIEFKPWDLDFQKITLTEKIILEDKNTLAYCRTGTRSITLWAFASCKNKEVNQVLENVSEAGYDLSHLKDVLVSYKSSLS